jgi:zinc protease
MMFARNSSPQRQAIAGILAAALAAAAVPPHHAAAAPNVGYFTLANGLEVVVIPDRRTTGVTHMIWYKVGAADEPLGKSGIAHFLEHLMFKGTEKHPIHRFSQVVASLGGQENAFTASDYTGYYQRVPREQLEVAMDFEADRMTGLVLTDEVVLPERDVVLEEQNQRVANNPGARLGEQIQAALYLNHPYGRPVIGWRHEIEKLDRADALAFYRRFYAPNNAVLIVAGNVTQSEVKELAEKTYGKIARRPDVVPRMRPQEPEPSAARSVTLADPRVEQPSVQRQYLVPSAATARRGEAEALEVLAHILGSGSNSRLYRSLVIEKGLAVNASAWYQGMSLDPTRFGIFASPRPGVSFAQVEELIDAELAKVAEYGVTAEELERAKTRLIADAVYAQDSQATLARWYGVALTTGSKVEDIATWPDRVRQVTAAAVRDAARAWLEKNRSVTGYLIKGESKREEKRS